MEQSFFQKTKHHVKKHWLTASFVLGFASDVIMLNQVDSLGDNLILLGYVILASLSLLLFYVGIAEGWGERLSKKLRRFMPAVMQYSFGGLLSGMLIFYGRSGDWITSAPFLLLILSVIFGNELVNKRSDRLVYHVSLYFIGVFSYIVLVLPVIFGVMGDLMFFLSGIVALIVVTILVQLLYRIVPNFMRVNTRRIILIIGAIYTTFNVLYFTAVLPPIPLSLTKLEMVHSVEKTDDGSYRVVTETQSWWRQLPFMRAQLHPSDGSLSCFARVYAPAKLATEIYHRWEYKDAGGSWVNKGRIEYPIAGTNKGGYRGYTTISGVQSGTWRCSVETARGQVLGRSTVVVNVGAKPQNLVTQSE
jgi:Protein of unknown function (DUF2914)